jgi:hypothetical protein
MTSNSVIMIRVSIWPSRFASISGIPRARKFVRMGEDTAWRGGWGDSRTKNLRVEELSITVLISR